jgi:endonuclease YncB( thermonuclease family)
MEHKTNRQFKTILLSLWVRYNISFVTVILLCCSTFYLIGAMRMRSYTSANNPHLFSTDDIVTILEIVDGDELLIGDDEGNTSRIRLLGIKSFSATLSDPLLSEYGKICFNYLKATAVGEKARLVVSEKRVDNKGRLLGTIFVKDSAGQYASDLGLDLVAKGYTLVYTEFDFKDMQAYMAVQDQAKRDLTGFWSNERISARASSMLLLWDQKRRKEEADD